MAKININKIHNVVEKNESNIVRVLKDLIKIPTVNPWFEPDPSLIQTKKAQKYISNYVNNLGAEIKLWEPDSAYIKEVTGYDKNFEDRPNLLARFKGNKKEPSLLLFGHIDVVSASNAWTYPPFKGEIDGGKIYGRGACDMKSGLTSMLMAMKCIKDMGLTLKGTVKLGSVVDEEAGGTGTIDFIKNCELSQAGILGEPTNLKISPLCRGILWGKIKIKGKSGHIEIDQPHWQDGGAVDAIEKSRWILKVIDQINKDWKRKKTHHLLPIPCQIKIAKINAGTHPTTYADYAEIVFNAQYLPREKDEEGRGSIVKNEIEKIISKAAKSDPWLQKNPPDIEWLVDAGCGEISVEENFVKEFKKASNSFHVKENLIEGATTHTDMDSLIEAGVKTVNFGPGKAKHAHQINEHVKVEDLIKSVKVLTNLIINWCGVEN